MANPVTPPGDITSDDRLWAMLSYIFAPWVSIIILLMEDKKNRPFIRAHSTQTLVMGIAFWVISAVLSVVAGLGCIIWVIYEIIMIIYALKANKGEYVDIPVVTNFVKNQGWA
jgi:uncharacterized protein